MVFRLLLKLFPTPGKIIALATFIIGMVYPTYNSFLAIESPNDADDKQWLTYWVVVCTLQLIERPLYVVLYWVPLYSIFRLVLVAWLSHPQFKGATLVYDIVVRPVIIAAASKAKELPALTPFAEKFLLSEVQAGQDKKTKATSTKSSSALKAPFSTSTKAAPPAAALPSAPRLFNDAPAVVDQAAPPLSEPAFLPADIVEGSLAAKPHFQ
ncbi:hypothetical protein ACKKBG_A08075 [Auxenochlorella protothecoides x Auxenochlorella symbiontica]